MNPSSCYIATDKKGRELTTHGSVAFPIAHYYDDIALHPVEWHWHEELEAGMILEGQARVVIGTEKRILGPGEGFFVNSEILHSIYSEGSSSCKLNSFVFHPRLVGGSPDSIIWQKYVSPLLNSDSLKGAFLQNGSTYASELLAAIQSVWQQCELKTPGYELEVRSILSKLHLILTQQLNHTQEVPSEKLLRDSARIKSMLQFIHEHYGESITMEQISSNAMISTSETLRCFRSTIGTTPIQYLKQYRIQKAAELLSSTTMKIADIGAQCGFQDMSYFSKIFREQKGMSPTDYRAMAF